MSSAATTTAVVPKFMAKEPVPTKVAVSSLFGRACTRSEFAKRLDHACRTIKSNASITSAAMRTTM